MRDESLRKTSPECSATRTSEKSTAQIASGLLNSATASPPLTSSPGVSPAKTSPSPAKARGSKKGRARASGSNSPGSFASYDPVTCSWKTFPPSGPEASTAYSGTWPRAGMTVNGTAYRRSPLAPLTGATDSSWLPTPSASSYGSNRGGSAGRVGVVRYSLQAMAARNLWPTPLAQDWKSGARPMSNETGRPLREVVYRTTPGPLNPTWVEWLMGFPLGWTDLSVSVTPSSPRSPSSSGGSLSPTPSGAGDE
jgi:hypothetical protein